MKFKESLFVEDVKVSSFKPLKMIQQENSFNMNSDIKIKVKKAGKFEKDTESSAHICPRGYREQKAAKQKKENPERSLSSEIENTFDFLGSQY